MRGPRDGNGLDEVRWQQLVACAAMLVGRGPKGDVGIFVAAVAWILRTGSPWPDLSERYGRWDRVYRRYRRWAVAGRWDALHRALSLNELHVLVTESGDLVRFVLTGGERNDITQAESLVVAREGLGVVGDRAYDSDAFVAHVKRLRMRAIVPARRARTRRRRLDRVRYARRNVIERWFGRMKAFRRIATRYEKTSSSYAGFVAAAATLIALTGWPG